MLLGDLQWVSGIAPGVETRGRKLESSGSNQRGMEVVQGLLYPQPGLQLKGGKIQAGWLMWHGERHSTFSGHYLHGTAK